MSDAADTLSPLKRALLKLDELTTKLAAAERAKHEPIAIVGVGCRFPGGADDPEAYWRMLLDGVDGVTEVPAARWDIDAIYDPDPSVPDKISSRWGGFIADVDKFDAAFFGLSPREAAAMDPQQRILLTVAWEALEDAGRTSRAIRGSATAVFVGVCAGDYLALQLAAGRTIDAYTTTGNSHSIVANRISHLLDLRGPSVAVDTACSSSLVAVHLACQSLRAGECSTALAAGVNLVLAPFAAISFSRWGMLAADGRCKAFDSRADGFVRGEGCGAVVLRRLSDALADGDPIVATIVGSASNQDGASAVLTAPNARAQQEVITAALASARVAPASIGFVEAHGSGTALGDPIEVGALAAALHAPDAGPCHVGSVKTNLGHLEAAAGIAGLIKAALCVERGYIPGNLHLRRLNPAIELAGTRLKICAEGCPWPASATPRRAGVSSFGFGGTNVHVILEAPPPRPVRATPADEAHLLLLSAPGERALRTRARQTADAIEADPALDLGDLGFTAARRRTHHTQRLAVCAADRETLVRRLRAVAAGETPRGTTLATAGPRRLGLVFSGQGTQWVGMANGLASQPVFHAALQTCDEAIGALAGWSVIEAIARDPGGLRGTDRAQPAIFAVQVALAALWRAWGVVPAAVIGHSVGEIAAAHVAGALSLTDAAAVVVRRGALMHAAHGAGAMASLPLPAEEIKETWLSGQVEDLAIAAINGPRTTVVSGGAREIDELLARLAAAGHKGRRLDVDYAFHGPQMLRFRAPLIDGLAGLRPGPATTPIYSTVTGATIPGEQLDAHYWGRNTCEPVDLLGAVERMLADGLTDLLEVGGHPALAESLIEILRTRDHDGAVATSLRRGQPQLESLLTGLGALHCRGLEVDLAQIFSKGGGRVVRLPTHPFTMKRHWLGEPWSPQKPAVTHGVHQLMWEPAVEAPLAAPAERWLVVGASDFAGEVAAELTRRCERCERVDNMIGEQLRGVHVVQLTALEVDDPLAIETRLLAPALLALREARRVFLVTRDAQAVTPEDRVTGLAGAALWGLARVAALETPVFAAVIDLAGAPSRELARRLVDHLQREPAEDQLAIRGDATHVPRLVRAEVPATTITFAPAATYLITGGQGAIGRELARWLADHGARRVVLVGRTATPTSDTLTLMRERPDVAFIVESADLGDHDQVAALLARIAAPDAPLRGIFHAAGVSHVAPLTATAPSTAILAGKAHGAWHLHILSRELPIEHFVCFASVSAVWGAAGLSLYAAANAVLDALTQHRRALGLPSTSIAWGPWATRDGMTSADDRARMAEVGVTALAPAAALAQLGSLLATRTSTAVVADVDWARLEPLLAARRPRPMLAHLKVTTDTTDADTGALQRLLDTTHPAERHDRLVRALQEAVTAVLELDADQQVHPAVGLFDLGMDSLTAVALKRRLERGLGRALSSTLVFEHPTITALAQHLAGEPISKAPEPAAATSEQALREVEAMTEDEARALLEQRRAARQRDTRRTRR